MFPLVFVILFLSTAFFPAGPAARAGEHDRASYNPLSFIVDAVRDPVISAFSARDISKGIAGIVLRRPRSGSTLSARALQRRLRMG